MPEASIRQTLRLAHLWLGLILCIPLVLIGLTPFSFSVWQCVFLLSILFHHSNVELPVFANDN